MKNKVENIVAPVVHTEAELPSMRWVKSAVGNYRLQICEPEIAGCDENGVLHYTGRHEWRDVPIFEDVSGGEL